jgi:hypothetical protein
MKIGSPTAKADLAMKVLAIDVGGTHVKILVTGERDHREFASGPKLTARRMVARATSCRWGIRGPCFTGARWRNRRT